MIAEKYFRIVRHYSWAVRISIMMDCVGVAISLSCFASNTTLFDEPGMCPSPQPCGQSLSVAGVVLLGNRNLGDLFCEGRGFINLGRICRALTTFINYSDSGQSVQIQCNETGLFKFAGAFSWLSFEMDQ